MRRPLIHLLAVLFLGGCPTPCIRVDERQAVRLDANQISPGAYELRFVATDGAKKGGKTTARLWLVRASVNDRSPRTGQPRRDRTGAPWSAKHFQQIPSYGATDFDDKRVGTVLCQSAAREGPKMGYSLECSEPDPSSCDPVYPGVIVFVSADGGIELLIGSLANIGDGSVYLDGRGVALSVKKIDSNGFYGTWGPAGFGGGSGYFCARRTGLTEPPPGLCR